MTALTTIPASTISGLLKSQPKTAPTFLAILQELGGASRGVWKDDSAEALSKRLTMCRNLAAYVIVNRHTGEVIESAGVTIQRTIPSLDQQIAAFRQRTGGA